MVAVVAMARVMMPPRAAAGVAGGKRDASSEDKSGLDASDGGFLHMRRVGRVRSIATYPLKGARGQTLDRAKVSLGSSTPRDREFALLRHENIEQFWASAGDGDATNDAVHAGKILATGEGKDPGHHSNKHLFHQLITDPSMVRYGVTMLGDAGIAVVDVATGATLVSCQDVSDASQRQKIEAFFGDALETSSESAPPSLVRAAGHSFANVGGRPYEHVLHLNAEPTVRECYEELVGGNDDTAVRELDLEFLESFALRFRPNIVIEDAGDGSLKPWSELGWCGHDVRVGPEVVLRINEPTIRCPSTRVRYDDSDAPGGTAVNVEPDVALRSAFPDLRAGIFGKETLLAEKGSYLGLYATVIQGGTMSPGDDIVVIG
mmetsp:Transcript_4518/g.20399  ORF Transcript_4518/g.20399 Transcript_4518/m.20399 type:complete len:376 (-) Transcript_4518:63-1190(-)